MPRDLLTLTVHTYGWNEATRAQREVCPLLTREWARSVCDKPWAAIRQALPANRFTLVDLGRLQLADPSCPGHCRQGGKTPSPIPQRPGEAVMVCEAPVHGGADDEFHHGFLRMDGDLGALCVCQHLLAGRPAPAGFIENSSDPHDLQAWCHACEEAFEREGGMTDAFREFNGMALVCVVCYAEAKNRHSLSGH